ncbi:DegV family protein [Chloroflexota bacterium]
MSKVGIVTDSIGCLPMELRKEYDIRVVPYSLTINGKAYQDEIELSPDGFWKLFPEMKEFSTGVPSLGQFSKVFTDLAQTTDSVVGIFISEGLSGAHEAATQAREMYKSENPNINIEIVDTRNVAGAEGFIVLEAARAAQAGKSLAEVVQVAQDMIPRVKCVFVMETLKYLIKSGRAPKAAYVGEMLQVKPIVGMVSNTGVIENIGKTMGKQKAMAKLVDLVKEHADTSKPIHLIAHYTDCIEDGEKLRDLITSQFKCEEAYLTPFTPVMSGHTGPVVALSFYS